jgi:Fic family protein
MFWTNFMTNSPLHATVPDVSHDRPHQKPVGDRLASARGVATLYDAAIDLIREAVRSGHFRLKIALVLDLHRQAYDGVDFGAGSIRTGTVRIENSEHKPPPPPELPVLLEEMCDYVNDNWELRSAIHLSAYVLWRILWIHPFFEGNGTVARALSYVVLSARQGRVLPGKVTIPEQIANHRSDYYAALAAADRAWSEGLLDVSKLEELLEQMMLRQVES